MKRHFQRMTRATAVIATALMLVLPYAQVGTLAPQTAQAVTPDATLTGRVLKPDGTPFAFPCMAPPGMTPPPGDCGAGVGASGGPGNDWWSGTDPNTGNFSFPVPAGKFRFTVNLPMELMGPYTFPETYVEIASGQTLDLGTITPREKQGHIKGQVLDSATNAPAADVPIAAYTMFRPEDGDSQGQNMMPSFGRSDASGNFDILVNAGRYGMNVEQRPDVQYVYDGQPIDVEVATDTSTVTGVVMRVTRADATITGRVLDEVGTQIQLPGSIAARPAGANDFRDYNAPIQPPGVFTIKVPSSAGTQYSLVIHLPPGELGYSIRGNVTVTIIPNGSVTQDVVLTKNSSTIFGKLVSQSGFALNSCTVTDPGKFGGRGFGEVFANSPQTGVFVNGAIKEDCSYTLSVGAGEYFFNYNLNPTAGYINRPTPPEPIVVLDNQNVEKNITVIAGDATITGQVLGANGEPIRAFVDAGNEREIDQAFRSAGQSGPQDESFRGPGDTKSPEDMMKFCSNKKNEKECKNFKLAPGTSGPGGCTNMLECTKFCTKNPKTCQEFDKGNHDTPEGANVVLGQGVKRVSAAGQTTVKAEDVTKADKGPDYFRDNMLHAGTQTDANGKFTLLIPSGHEYEVRANVPPELDGGSLLPPKSVVVNLKTVKTASVALQFRNSFGTMSGKVLMPDGSAATIGFVHFWSEDGANGGSPVRPDGTYSMGYDVGKLHLGADAFIGNSAYRSTEELVVVTTQKTMTKNLTLKEASFKPFQPTSKTFSADESTSMTLDNGATLTIPSGSIAASGQVTVSAQPTVDLKSSQTDSPVDIGYSLTATDSNGNEISSFNSSVTITLPYDGDYVTDELGLDESVLSSKYVSGTSGAYESITTATQDETADTFTLTVDHFTDFAVVGASIGGNTKQVTTSSSGGKVKVSIDGAGTINLGKSKTSDWNIGTANFGDKVGGQLIVVSRKTKAGDLRLYSTNGKLKKKLYPFGKSYKGGFQQVVEDVDTKSGSAQDGTSDVVVAPTNGVAKAYVYDLKNGGTKGKPQAITTGNAGATGKTTLTTLQLKSGSSTLTTLFGDSDVRAWKLSKGKLVRDSSSKTLGKLRVKSGSVEKKTETPKVKKSSSCKTSGSSKMSLTGSGFTDSVILLWNGATALAGKTASNGTKVTFTLNSEAVDINSVNTLTIVNADGQAGVKVLKCK